MLKVQKMYITTKKRDYIEYTRNKMLHCQNLMVLWSVWSKCMTETKYLYYIIEHQWIPNFGLRDFNNSQKELLHLKLSIVILNNFFFWAPWLNHFICMFTLTLLQADLLHCISASIPELFPNNCNIILCNFTLTLYACLSNYSKLSATLLSPAFQWVGGGEPSLCRNSHPLGNKYTKKDPE